MWQTLLAFVGHRLLLAAVIFLAINSALPSARLQTEGSTLPEIRPTSSIVGQFLSRIVEASEFSALQSLSAVPAYKVFSVTTQPFLWLARWLTGPTGWSPHIILLLLSNLFFLLFLHELHALLMRYATSDIAATVSVLAVLWPTSYEMSLGSSFSLICFLSILAVRTAIDGYWWVSSVALALLILSEPLGLGILVLVLIIFWFMQRHLTWKEFFGSLGYLLFIVVLAIVWKWFRGGLVTSSVSESALMSLMSKGGQLGWTFSQSVAGQTLCLIFFAAGAVSAFLSNTVLLHRIVPVGFLVVVVAFSPYSTLASRVLLAAACLQGIAGISSGLVQRIVQVLLLLLSMYEVYAVFR